MTIAAQAVADRAPFMDMLRQYQAAGTVPFSCPGHKRGRGATEQVRELLGDALFDCDVWFNTGDHDRLLRSAEALAARVWAADRSFFLVNGSSSGNHAYLLAALRPGDEVIVARDLHKSLLVGLILTGARPVYVTPRLHPELGIGLGLEADDVAAALDRHPAAKLVALVSPSYYGVATDLSGVVEAAHSRAVPVYVDEAWGPHLGFHPALPDPAMVARADGAVTSTHKILSSLSQSSILNVRTGLIDPARVAQTVRMMQTTSPLLPLLSSLDACRQQMAERGEELVERALELAGRARARLLMLPGLDVLGPDRLGLDPRRYDPLKLVIDVARLGMTGLQAETALRERFAIAPEGSDLVRVVCVVTLGDTPQCIDQLIGAFTALCAEHNARPAPPAPRRAARALSEPTQALTPRDAFFSPTRSVPLQHAAGKVAAELVLPYPPGIPVLAPGEVIDADAVDYLLACRAAGSHICGPADPRLGSIRIVDRD
ncbi:MAG: aminotransferase class I/II-fold pyridoxal phosphate-dependent enzyme [Actinomycetota bacterium]